MRLRKGWMVFPLELFFQKLRGNQAQGGWVKMKERWDFLWEENEDFLFSKIFKYLMNS